MPAHQVTILDGAPGTFDHDVTSSPVGGDCDYKGRCRVWSAIGMALDIANKLLNFVIASISEGLVLVDLTGKIQLMNRAAKQILGPGCPGLVPGQDDLAGADSAAGAASAPLPQPAHHLQSGDRGAVAGDAHAGDYGAFLPDQRTRCPLKSLPLSRALRGEVIDGVEIWVRNAHRPGGVKLRVSASPLKDKAGNLTGAVCVFTEMSARLDPVTSLPNRDVFFEHLRHAVQRAGRQSRKCGIVFLDLDRFKEVNESLGHSAGDQLLARVAQMLVAIVGEDDFTARLGGDEFALVVESMETEMDLAILVEKLSQQLADPIAINGHDVYPTASIGIAVYPDDGADPETLAKHADTALSTVKEQGTSKYQFYTRRMNAVIVKHFMLENNLRRAIGTSELQPFFQPQLDLSSGRAQEAEVLIRWRHPQMGFVSPAEFIPLAEKTGLIDQISEQILSASCQRLRNWRERQVPVKLLAVNMSAKLFTRKDLAKDVYAVIEQCGLSPADLLIEITESTIMQSPEQAEAIVAELKGMGFALALDDFGTGYSSLSYLQRFRVDQVKIDRSFITDLGSSTESKSIVRAIIAMCSSLGLETLAEGVETEEQLDILRALGCNKVQGYLVGKALSAEEFEQFLLSAAR